MEEIVILHTNDLHSHLNEWPKIRRYLLSRQQELRRRGQTVITLDLGDFSDRVHPLTEATDGRSNTRLMNQVGYDGVTIGNNEGIGNSYQQLQELYEQANFDVLLGNLIDPITGQLPEWAHTTKVITSKGGTRIGLIGLTAPFPLTYEPNGWTILFPDEVLPAILAELVPNSDVIVLMSHLGIQEETRIAETYPEIDVILGSHTHHLLTDGLVVNQSLLAAAGKFGQYVGEVSLKVEKNTLLSKQARVQATATLPSEAGDETEIEAYLSHGQELLARQVLGNLPETYWQKVNRRLALIDLGIAALVQQTNSQAVLLNSGLFLTDLKAGPVTALDLHRCLPHPMHLLNVTLTGTDLRQLLKEISQQKDELRDYPVVGMGFRGKVFGEIKSVGISWTEDLTDIRYLGQPIINDESYSFVTVDHLLFIPFFPTIAKKGQIELIFPDFLRTILGKYLQEAYPIT